MNNLKKNTHSPFFETPVRLAYPHPIRPQHATFDPYSRRRSYENVYFLNTQQTRQAQDRREIDYLSPFQRQKIPVSPVLMPRPIYQRQMPAIYTAENPMDAYHPLNYYDPRFHGRVTFWQSISQKAHFLWSEKEVSLKMNKLSLVFFLIGGLLLSFLLIFIGFLIAVNMYDLDIDQVKQSYPSSTYMDSRLPPLPLNMEPFDPDVPESQPIQAPPYPTLPPALGSTPPVHPSYAQNQPSGHMGSKVQYMQPSHGQPSAPIMPQQMPQYAQQQQMPIQPSTNTIPPIQQQPVYAPQPIYRSMR